MSGSFYTIGLDGIAMEPDNFVQRSVTSESRRSSPATDIEPEAAATCTETNGKVDKTKNPFLYVTLDFTLQL